MSILKPEQPRPTELLNQPSLEQVQQTLRELKERASNLLISLHNSISYKSKITQKEIATLELSIQQIITDCETFRRVIIFSPTPEFIELEESLRKQIKEFKTESTELLRQLKGRANRNSLAGKIRKIFN
jgi:hypothetical protein